MHSTMRHLNTGDIFAVKEMRARKCLDIRGEGWANAKFRRGYLRRATSHRVSVLTFGLCCRIEKVHNLSRGFRSESVNKKSYSSVNVYLALCLHISRHHSGTLVTMFGAPPLGWSCGNSTSALHGYYHTTAD